MPPFSKFVRCAVVAMLAAGLAGCSEYLERRDGLSVQSGNAVETNKIAQMVDPWPPYAGNRSIAFSGPVMGSAVERYRTGRVIPPVGNGTSGAFQSLQQNSNGGSAASSQPTAPPPAVK
jgi:hypothetical protein